MSWCTLMNVLRKLSCQDMLWSVLPRRGDRLAIEEHISGPVLAAAVRLAIFAAGCSVALLVRASCFSTAAWLLTTLTPAWRQAFGLLGNTISLLGGIASISCSLLLPSAFYLALFWKDVSALVRAGVVLLLAGGVSVLVLVTTQNVADILSKLHRVAAGSASVWTQDS